MYEQRGRFAAAEQFLRQALERATDRHTSPKDGEPFYYLGLALKSQGKIDDAFNQFSKSTWSGAWRNAGYFEMAQIATLRGDFPLALTYANNALNANSQDLRALALKAALLLLSTGLTHTGILVGPSSDGGSGSTPAISVPIRPRVSRALISSSFGRRASGYWETVISAWSSWPSARCSTPRRSRSRRPYSQARPSRLATPIAMAGTIGTKISEGSTCRALAANRNGRTIPG